MKNVSWDELFEKLGGIKFKEDFDLIVAVADGGLIPAAFLQNNLKIPMDIIKINYRDEDNVPRYCEPKIVGNKKPGFKDKKILLVDDVLRSGKTVLKAKELLEGNDVCVFVLNGNADYSLFCSEECMKWPWT